MDGIGAEVSEKIRSAIKAKFKEIGLHVDEELPEYVMIMVANKRSKEQMNGDLELFLGKHTTLFTTWLHQVLQKLQEVTVAKLGVKRKSSDDVKKKNKSKQDSEKKETKKKIKEEPEDKEGSPKSKYRKRERKDHTDEEDSNQSQSHEAEHIRKEKTVSKTVVDQTNDTNSFSKTKKHKEDVLETRRKSTEEPRGSRSKSQSISSQVEDLDDEDCINIRTDGELLDTTEDISVEESSKKSRGKEETVSKNKSDKKDEKRCSRQSPARSNKDKSKSLVHNTSDEISSKEPPKKQSSPPKSFLPNIDDKVIDARELLNRKKAAKQADNKTRSRSRSKDRERSLSPVRKRKDDERESRSHRDERGSHRRAREDEREASSRRHSRDDDRDRRGKRDREPHSVRHKGDSWPRKLESDKLEQRNRERKRDSSNEPPPKRLMIERPFRNKNDDLESPPRGRKAEMESPKRKESEEGRKRPGVVSRVVPRAQEPEDSVEAPVPSVVKVTPRPRRPPSQQPSSNLIMKAISEANKSLANVSQRPDSTQRGRKEPVYPARNLGQLRRIQPVNIEVEITNPLAHQNDNPVEKEDDDRSVSPIPKDKSGRNMSPPPSNHFNKETTPSEPESTTPNSIQVKVEKNNVNEEKPEEEPQQDFEDELQLETSPDLETNDEPIDEMSEPQFVVTLNGYDPDGIFSQSELEDDDWLKDRMDEEPLLTSTPAELPSPRPNREMNSSPNVIMNTPAVNHNNLIEVEILKTKNPERCKYWPACRLGDKCTYYHPSKPCKIFPNCKFGDACLYIHPQCKFNALCTRQNCVFAHTPAHTPVQPAAVPKAKALYAASAPPCKFYPNCTNAHCQFAHLPRACRFGIGCTKRDCTFDHHQVAPVNKLKWTRVSTT